MRVPKDLRVRDLCGRLERLGYGITRERGSHLTLTTERGGRHSLRIPDKSPVAPGTLRSILRSAARHAGLGDAELIDLLGLTP
jgi:predicted RNA binding protein YcfA (HicA-like mRNA interferase family)